MNNIFKYATKELSQDAFLCWSINWLTESADNPLYLYGKAMLDLFLGDKKQERYSNVEVRSQYEKIDVLVLFKDCEEKPHALIIEDKTNTSEHGNQLSRYKDEIKGKISSDKDLKEYVNSEILSAYVKTGIMYDEDVRMKDKADTVIDLDALLEVVSGFARQGCSEILTDFYLHIQGIKDRRVEIEAQIENGNYEAALKDAYGQFCFLDKIFIRRSKGTNIGTRYAEHKENPPIYVDNIYSGTNNGGTPWTQYCFWGEKYPRNYIDENENEYHYLFWRIDCKWRKNKADVKSESTPYFYIALRHYDEHAHSDDDYLNKRKIFVYNKFRKYAEDNYEKKCPELFNEVGVRENYKESDLLFIPVEKIANMGFDEIQKLLLEITDSFGKVYDNLYYGMEEALKEN